MSLLSKIISLGIILSSISPQLKSLRFKKGISKEDEESPTEISDEALLTEYQVCQHDINSSAQSYWTLTGIFIGFSSVILGGLIYGILSDKVIFDNIFNDVPTPEKLVLGSLMILMGTIVITVLYFLKGWLRRVTFLQQINYDRMREIENKLVMYKSWRVHGIDHMQGLTFDDEILSEDRKRLFSYKPQKWWLENRYGSERKKSIYEGSSRRHFTGIFSTLIVMWSLVLISGIILLSFYSVVAHSFIALWVVLGVTVFILSVILLCKKLYK